MTDFLAQLSDDDLAELTDQPTTESLIKLVGEKAFCELSASLGGRRLYFPHKPGADTPLAFCIGMELATRVCSIYGGMMYDIPVEAGKREMIRRLHKEGLTQIKIAHRLRVSRSTVMRTLKEQHTSQLNLF